MPISVKYIGIYTVSPASQQTYRDCQHWILLEFSDQREAIQADLLPSWNVLSVKQHTIQEQTDRLFVHSQENLVPLGIEEEWQRTENNSLFFMADRYEREFNGLGFSIESNCHLFSSLHVLHLPNIPYLGDGGAPHAQHRDKGKLLWKT